MGWGWAADDSRFNRLSPGQRRRARRWDTVLRGLLECLRVADQFGLVKAGPKSRRPASDCCTMSGRAACRPKPVTGGVEAGQDRAFLLRRR